MPKPFMLVIEVEESATGTVMRRLHGMPGVISLHLDLDAAAKPKGLKKNGEPRGQYKPRNADAAALKLTLLKLVGGGKPVERKAIHAALNPSGAKPKKTSLRNMLYNNQRDGFLKDAGKGQVVITEKGRAALKTLQSK